jgi:hypothetical protein
MRTDPVVVSTLLGELILRQLSCTLASWATFLPSSIRLGQPRNSSESFSLGSGGGWFEEAVAVGELVLTMSGRHPWAVMSLAATFRDWGKLADAEALYAELVARSRRSYVQPVTLAIAAAAAGIQEDAIRHARAALELRDPLFQLWFPKHWPYSSRLRAYPRFLDIVASAGME